ncbi:cytochrome P450 [Hypoxylon sp. FL1150]|nr:cytochrome P450 [Hypoxylon sp. FL1150]
MADKCQGLSVDVLWPEAVLFILTGGATTATTMSAIFCYLAENPECLNKLTAEIQSVFNSASEIHSGAQPNSCKYLRTFIDETLRLSPPSLTSLWHEQDANDTGGEPFNVDEHNIPRGTHIAVSLHPFLIGDRAYADKSMAYIEVSLTLGRMLWFFDFEMAPGKDGEVGQGKPGRTDGRRRRDEF